MSEETLAAIAKAVTEELAVQDVEPSGTGLAEFIAKPADKNAETNFLRVLLAALERFPDVAVTASLDDVDDREELDRRLAEAGAESLDVFAAAVGALLAVGPVAGRGRAFERFGQLSPAVEATAALMADWLSGDAKRHRRALEFALAYFLGWPDRPIEFASRGLDGIPEQVSQTVRRCQLTSVDACLSFLEGRVVGFREIPPDFRDRSFYTHLIFHRLIAEKGECVCGLPEGMGDLELDPGELVEDEQVFKQAYKTLYQEDYVGAPDRSLTWRQAYGRFLTCRKRHRLRSFDISDWPFFLWLRLACNGFVDGTFDQRRAQMSTGLFWSVWNYFNDVKLAKVLAKQRRCEAHGHATTEAWRKNCPMCQSRFLDFYEAQPSSIILDPSDRWVEAYLWKCREENPKHYFDGTKCPIDDYGRSQCKSAEHDRCPRHPDVAHGRRPTRLFELKLPLKPLGGAGPGGNR